ncbi:VOC family protein [Devosia sp.]|uniref:VOC family protein n=1 Tax=Devosia sp. TaxID=1871048 RepID=UPI00326515E5
MFANRAVSAMLPANDLERAKRWYAEVLGISPTESSPYGASYSFGGVTAYMYQSEFAGTAKHTLFTFTSSDVEADMKALRAKGVVFLDYDLPGLKTVNGLATFGPVKNAWAQDSEGNILGFVEGM